MHTIDIAIKASKELSREKSALFFMLAFPAIFMFVFSLAFGAEESVSSMDLVVFNEDEPVLLGPTPTSFGDIFVDILGDVQYSDNSTELFAIDTSYDDLEEANESLGEGTELIVVIPRNFTIAVLNMMNHTTDLEVKYCLGQVVIQGGNVSSDCGNGTGSTSFDENASIHILLIGNYANFGSNLASSMVQSVLDSFIDGVLQTTRAQIAQETGFVRPVISASDLVLTVLDEPQVLDTLTVFDILVPGFMVFAMLMTSMSVSTALVVESESGTLERMKLTGVSARAVVVGTFLAYLVIGIVQVLILLGVAILLGFSWAGSLMIGLLVAMIGIIASIALGLIISAMVDTEKKAGTLAPVLTVPLSFFVGAFFPLPDSVSRITDWLPWSQVVHGLRAVYTFGGGFSDIWDELLIGGIGSIILLVISIVIYAKVRLTWE